MTFVTGSLGQFLRLGLQQIAESFLYSSSHQLFDLISDYFLAKRYNLFRHGLPSLSE